MCWNTTLLCVSECVCARVCVRDVRVQYACPGFLKNARQHRQFGLAAVEVAQVHTQCSLLLASPAVPCAQHSFNLLLPLNPCCVLCCVL
jgi:hypothetical protein